MSNPKDFVGGQHKVRRASSLNPNCGLPVSTATSFSNQLRIFHLNDVYTIKNLPNFFTAVKELSAGVPSLIMHSGDMLSPPADVRDFGHSMIQSLNILASHIPIVATFGNHECDVPTEQLEHALNASKFNWVLSNFDSSYLHVERCLPSHVIIDVNDKPTLGVVGLLTNNRAEYGCIPCGGTTISDPLESIPDMIDFQWNFDIPQVALTHLDTASDEQLALRAPVVAILGGHDHDVLSKRVSHPQFPDSFPTPILKSGEDAVGFHVVDLFFDDMGDVESITYKYHFSRDFVSDPALQGLVDDMLGGDVAEMVQTVVATVPEHVQDRRTDRVRWGLSDMASYLLDVLKQAFGAEIVLISSGNIRGKRQYTEGVVTEADINAEFPFYDNKPIVRFVPGYIIANMIRRSRQGMGTEPKSKFRWLRSTSSHLTSCPVVHCLQRRSCKQTRDWNGMPFHRLFDGSTVNPLIPLVSIEW